MFSNSLTKYVNLDSLITKLKEKYIIYSPYFMCILMLLSNCCTLFGMAHCVHTYLMTCA